MTRKIISLTERDIQILDKKSGEILTDYQLKIKGEREFMPVKAPYIFMTQDMDWDEVLTGSALRVLIHLLKTMKPGGVIMRSRTNIAKTLKMKRETVGTAIKELVRERII